jgi:hypothetical protein
MNKLFKDKAPPISEKNFGTIQRDRVSEMNNWASEIKNVEGGKERGRSSEEVSVAMIAANNHYAGFGLGTVTYSGIW